MNSHQNQIAQDAYENYNFGDNVEVIGDNGWESDGSLDFIKVAFVEFDNEQSDHSEKVSFHVKFKKSNPLEIDEVYALLVRNGSQIGFWNQPSKVKTKNSL